MQEDTFWIYKLYTLLKTLQPSWEMLENSDISDGVCFTDTCSVPVV